MRLLTVIAAIVAAGCGRDGYAPSAYRDSPPPDVRATEPPPRAPVQETRAETTHRRVTLAFREAHVRDVLDAIARASGGNIVMACNVEGRITVTFHDVPWNEAVDAVVKSVSKAMAIWERPDLVRIVDP